VKKSMKNYILERYTSRNTSFDERISKRNGKSAENIACRMSTFYHFPVSIRDERGAFAKFENGEKIEWSMMPLK